MMEEIGTVVELKDKHIALVLCKKGSFCEHCASAGACQLGEDGKTMLVEAHNPLGAAVGQRVKLAVSSRVFLQSSFLVYIVPIVALIVGAVAGELIGRHLVPGVDPNLLAAIIGTAFLVGAFLILRVGSRALPKDAYLPRIVAIVPEDS